MINQPKMIGGLSTILILATIGLCFLTSTHSAGWQVEPLWRETFTDIFGPFPNESQPMSSRELLKSLLFLNRTAGELVTIDQSDKQTVEFWHERVFGFAITAGWLTDETNDALGHCKLKYLKDTRERYEQQNIANNSNFEHLYVASRKHLIEFCENYYLALIHESTSKLSRQVMDFLGTYSEYKVASSTKEAAKALARPIMKLIDASPKATGARIVEAWQRGPCSNLLSDLRRPRMEPFGHFIAMCKFDLDNPPSQCSGLVKQWVEVVYMC